MTKITLFPKVGSTEQEFDLNLVFKWNKNACQIVNLGQDPKKKNFGNIMVTKPDRDLSQSEHKIVFNDNGVIYISPKKVILMGPLLISSFYHHPDV